MKKYFLILISFMVNLHLSAQLNERGTLDPALEPFYHGVASGDPTTTSVIIWTRVTTDEPSAHVYWKMATDTSFQNVVANGYFDTDASRDYTVKVDVNGLQPNTFYFYEFTVSGKNSLTGRTKTLPEGDISQLRLATVSCANYQSGYYNAYERIAARNDVDAIIHLGDYIYEYGDGEYGELIDRVPEPEDEIISLSDYRLRHSFYKLDPMLRKLHQMYPFFTIWDDHESADNSYMNGAENHQNNEGEWSARKQASIQAYHEWMPIRTIDPNKIFRKVSFGNLADVFYLDTRLYDRQEQDPGSLLTGKDDSTHYLLGPEQMDWLQQGLLNSTAKWKIIAQQVMVAPLQVFGIALNDDQWDGYPTDRKRLFDFIDDHHIDNVVVLTGDIHTAWAMDLPFGNVPYKPEGIGSAGVEFVCTSITSPGFPIGFVANVIKTQNPHIKYADLTDHGYSLLNITEDSTQNDFYTVRSILEPDTVEYFRAGYYTLLDSNHLHRNNQRTFSTILPGIIPPAFPEAFDPTGVKDNQSTLVVTGVYPNPFSSYVGLQFYLEKGQNVTIKIYDILGEAVTERNLGDMDKGIHFQYVNTQNLVKGNYIISIELADGNSIQRKIIKQ